MNTDLSRQSTPAGAAITESAGTCRYCGSFLLPHLYFCPVCATPYKNPESVLTPIRPAAPSEAQLIQIKVPQVWPLFWTYLGVVVGISIASVLMFGPGENSGYEIAASALLGSLAIGVTTGIFTVRHWASLKVQLMRIGLFSPYAWLAGAILVPLLAINYFYHSWLSGLVGGEADWRGEAFSQLGRNGVLVLFCILPGVLEEIAFRGLVQHWLQVALRPWRAMILASFLFTVLHFSIPSAPYLFAVGMLLGWTKYKTGSLYPGMILHAVHNWVALAYF